MPKKMLPLLFLIFAAPSFGQVRDRAVYQVDVDVDVLLGSRTEERQEQKTHLPEIPGTFNETVVEGSGGNLRIVEALGVLNVLSDKDGHRIVWIAVDPTERFTAARCWGRAESARDGSGFPIKVVGWPDLGATTLGSHNGSWVRLVGTRRIVGGSNGHAEWVEAILVLQPPK